MSGNVPPDSLLHIHATSANLFAKEVEKTIGDQKTANV